MAYTTINKSGDNFDAKIYTGNGSSQTLTMDNLGLLWMKLSMGQLLSIPMVLIGIWIIWSAYQKPTHH